MIDNSSVELGNPIKNGMSRRDFLRKVPRAGAGALGAWVGWNIGQHERSMIENNTFVCDGVQYFPMYEAHAEGPREILPENTAGLFLEGDLRFDTLRPNTNPPIQDSFDQYQMPVDTLVEMLGYYQGTQVPRRVELIDRARKLHIPVGLGDIFPREYNEKLRFSTPEDVRKFWGGVAISVLSQVPDKVRSQIEDRVKKSQALISRRSFLKLSAAATAGVALGGLSYGSWLATDTAFFERNTLDNSYPQPFNRLLKSLYGFTSNFHPEDPVLFMRNVIWAIKLKDMGAMLKSHKDTPLLAYNVGEAHQAPEYLIGLPESVLQAIFMYANKEYFQSAKDQYGANIAKTRIIQADEKGVFRDLPPLVNQKLLAAVTHQ